MSTLRLVSGTKNYRDSNERWANSSVRVSSFVGSVKVAPPTLSHSFDSVCPSALKRVVPLLASVKHSWTDLVIDDFVSVCTSYPDPRSNYRMWFTMVVQDPDEWLGNLKKNVPGPAPQYCCCTFNDISE